MISAMYLFFVYKIFLKEPELAAIGMLLFLIIPMFDLALAEIIF